MIMGVSQLKCCKLKELQSHTTRFPFLNNPDRLLLFQGSGFTKDERADFRVEIRRVKERWESHIAKRWSKPPVTEEEDAIGCSFLLNLVDAREECFSNEAYAHTDELSLEALSEMVKTLDRIRREFSTKNPENFLNISSELEQIYDLCREHIKLLEPSEALDIMKQYFIAIIPPDGASGNIPDNSTWQDCLVFLLNFWLRLTEERQEFASTEISVEKTDFHPDCLMSCLKVL
ncbi:hypothetical protein V6N13_077217 [Hibiscus sabdariffa]